MGTPQENELDRARWEGNIEARLNVIDQTSRSTDAKFEAHAAAMHTWKNAMEIRVNTLAVKFGFVAAFGSFVGSGVVSALVAYYFKR